MKKEPTKEWGQIQNKETREVGRWEKEGNMGDWMNWVVCFDFVDSHCKDLSLDLFIIKVINWLLLSKLVLIFSIPNDVVQKMKTYLFYGSIGRK